MTSLALPLMLSGAITGIVSGSVTIASAADDQVLSGAAIMGIVLAVIGVVALFWVIGTYNGLVRGRNQVKNSWSQIDVQLKRRHDLIPNLVETVKGYASHEKDTLENVMKARSAAQSAQGPAAQGKAEGELSQALSRLMMVVEAYPDLKANENFLSLQEELTSTENKITFARQYYNDEAMKFNNKREVFPSNMIAGMSNFKEAEFFELTDETQREAPSVKF